MNGITENSWLQKEHASSLHDGGLSGLFHVTYVWGKFGEWAGSLKKGAFIEAEGKLRYREFQPNASDAKIRTAEIHATSILTLDRAEKTEHEGETAAAELSGNDDVPF